MKRIVNGLFLRAPILLLIPLLCSAAERSLVPALVVTEDDKAHPLGITEVEVKIRLVGCLAETEMTMVFQNDYDRDLEGDLYFPLPEGATVSGYALDVDGIMVEGVAVEKIKGRQVLEALERRRIDPGLVEWTQGNAFKTRIFPIPANSNRTVRVSYVSELTLAAESARFSLPLNFTNRLKEIRFQVEARQSPAPPALSGQWPDDMRFEPQEGGYRAAAKSVGVTVSGALEIRVPQREGPQVLVEKAGDGQYYFVVNDQPRDPRAGKAVTAPKPPKRVTLFWDASGSRKDADHAKEWEFLRAYLGQFPASVIDLRLVCIRNTASEPQQFLIVNGNTAALEQSLAALPYDGGTRLECLDPKAAGSLSDQYLLFSDGLNSLGGLESLHFSQPLFIVCSSGTLDAAVLRKLAAGSGGGYVNLGKASVAEALALMNGQVLMCLGVQGGPGAVDASPRLAQPVYQRCLVAGRMTDDTAKVLINYGVAGKRLASSTVKLTRASATPGETLRRYWAQKRLDDLLVMGETNREAILELGKQHALVTPETSLMVLDNLEQYVIYRIQPPASLPEMRAEYAKAIKEVQADELAEKHAVAEREKEAKEELIAQWQERVKWWQTDFRERMEAAGRKPEAQPPLMVTPLPNTGRVEGTTGQAAGVAAAPGRDAHDPRNESNAARARIQANSAAMGFAPVSAPAVLAEVAGDPEGMAAASIELKEYDPKTPYLDALKEVPVAERYGVYLQHRNKYFASPGFFLDCADFFHRQGDRPTALRVLSNLAEMETENVPLLRVMARRLEQIDELDLAIASFEQILRLRPDEPQSSRDLALALAKRGKRNHSQRDGSRALDLLATVINGNWERYEDIKLLVLMEFNALWAEHAWKYPGHQKPLPIDRRLNKLLDLDVRIVLTWDADNTDIDLHVVEPNGERAYYARSHTDMGGLVGEDITAGNGPEEYCLRRAYRGSFKIEVDYFGSDSASVLGPVTVQAEVITDFGRPNEKRRNMTLRVTEEKEHLAVGEIKIDR